MLFHIKFFYGGKEDMEAAKIRSALIRTLCALVICTFFVIVKFVLRDTDFFEEVYNYLSSDVVFPK